MIHHIVLFKLKPEVTSEKVEEMMMNTRMQLLKIPEVLAVKCGKRVSTENEWQFFLSVDVESLDKLELYRQDPNHIKFVEDFIKPNTIDRVAYDYEMEPGKDVQFS